MKIENDYVDKNGEWRDVFASVTLNSDFQKLENYLLNKEVELDELIPMLRKTRKLLAGMQVMAICMNEGLKQGKTIQEILPSKVIDDTDLKEMVKECLND